MQRDMAGTVRAIPREEASVLGSGGPGSAGASQRRPCSTVNLAISPLTQVDRCGPALADSRIIMFKGPILPRVLVGRIDDFLLFDLGEEVRQRFLLGGYIYYK